MNFLVTSSPHIRASVTTRSLMRDVIFALIPALVMGIVFQGVRALVVTVVSVATCLIAEFLYGKIVYKKNTVKDASAAVTGFLLAMILPANVSLGAVVLGAVFAIIVVKALSGGLGNNIFNPALAGRAILMLLVPAQIIRFAAPGTALPLFGTADIISAATPLHEMRMPIIPKVPVMDLIIGRAAGCIGEVSALMLILGGIYLIVRKVISWHIPVAYLGTVAVLALVFSKTDAPLMWMVYNLVSGGVMLGAFFMATDYATSPTSNKGKLIYGIGCGILTYVFRNVGLYPESVTYSILLMNALSWAIDRFTAPRVFGKEKGGRA
ncbi:MAG: RnfABCDGE type electron transport complex subunit D [Eubacteriales bacterium]|nr:RnfABCDGE type electron transport complex subunit D [Eubacteriales bacterium]